MQNTIFRSQSGSEDRKYFHIFSHLNGLVMDILNRDRLVFPFSSVNVLHDMSFESYLHKINSAAIAKNIALSILW